MKSMKLSNIIQIVKPEYVFLKVTPNNSIRNQKTNLIARTIASMYKGIMQNIKKEEEKLFKFFRKEMVVGTRYSYNLQGKVAFYIYMKNNTADFYFIIPKRQFTVLKERMTNVWGRVTIKEVDEIPMLDDSATKYQMVYEKEDGLSLKTDSRSNDLLTSQMNVIDVLEDDDEVGIFYNFYPINQNSFRYKYVSTIDKVQNEKPVERNKMGLKYAFKQLISILDSIVQDVTETIAGENKNKKEDGTERLLRKLNGNKNQISDSTNRKGTASILGTQIVAMSKSDDPLRQRNNATSIVQSFETITDNNKLIGKKIPKKTRINIQSRQLSNIDTNHMSDMEVANFIALPGKEILEQYDFIPKIATQETQVPEDLRKGVMSLGENIYRGIKQRAYLSNYEHYRNLLLLLIAPTRAGKSNFISHLAIDAIENDECVVVFDFVENNKLSDDISALFPKEQVLTIDTSDMNNIQGLGYNEVGFNDDPFKQYENAKRQTSNLLALVNAINVDESRLSAKMERYLEASALAVFINNGSIRDVFRVLQNHKIRHQYIDSVHKDDKYTEFMEEYTDTLLEIDEKNKDGEVIGTRHNSIVGIIDRLSVLKRNTQMELMLKTDMKNNVDLVEEMQKNQVICIRMPESKFPTESERDICSTYWITKIWLALQLRADKFREPKDRKKVNLLIDEIYQVKNTEKFITKKLSQIAKFICKPIITCHYINQLEHMRNELRSANTSYMLLSGCDKKNFDELKDELYPFAPEDLKNLKPYHSMNYIKSKEGYARFITKLPGKVEDRIRKENKAG